ncbi:MAG: anthranilate phosphoribosyltransferase [Trueperaceae bacterium]|nr:anthranilate phosphoribosyltransferase [Trueperaceae bacterium]
MTDAPESSTFDVATTLSTIFEGRTLTRERAREVMGMLMDGELSQMQAAALLAALRTRGETVDEIIGFAEAMRERSIRVPVADDGPLLDICGTGGTGVSTINVSTTAAFVAAAGGARLAKHGNRGVTKRSGSADVLEALGVGLDLDPDRLSRAIEEIGLAFLFARRHHPAMRFVAPIRADLKARTIFNNLGPLTNPAGASRQLMGVYSPALTRTLAEVLRGLGLERALVVHGDGLDDFTISGETFVSELRPDGEIVEHSLVPEDVGLERAPRATLLGGDPADNAVAARAILSGERRGPQRDVVQFNAGAALYLADLAGSVAEGVERAGELLDDGAGLRTLERYVAFSRG